ncbi:NDP-hexose 4-ketoreductase, partial [Candidatus Saccharibacteria bacterium]|nr:NDP-hexose 4-ketoreductase [Candidatus Saccharibacteria bacterium]
RKNILHILDLQIAELKERLVKHGLSVRLTTKAKNYMLAEGYDAHNGVRPMRRLIQDTLEDHIATQLLHEAYKPGDIIEVDVQRKQLVYKAVSESAKTV